MKKFFKSILGLIFSFLITAGTAPLNANVRSFFAWHYNDVTWQFDAQYICLVSNSKRDSAELAREKARLSAEYPNYMVKSVIDELGQHICPFCLSCGRQSQKLKFFFEMGSPSVNPRAVNYCDVCLKSNFVFASGEDGIPVVFETRLDEDVNKYNHKSLGQLLSEYIVQLKAEREARMKRVVAPQSMAVYPTTRSVMAREVMAREEDAKMYERHRKCLEEEAYRLDQLRIEKREEERIARESRQDSGEASEQPVLPEHREVVQSTAQALGVGQQQLQVQVHDLPEAQPEVHQEEELREGDELFIRTPPEDVEGDRSVAPLLALGERILPERTHPIEEDYDG